MGKARILLLNAGGVVAYRCSRGQATPEARFGPERTGFCAYLESRSGESFALLVDVADEEFSLDRLPHVLGRGRLRLLARRREGHSRGSPLCAAIPAGRDSDGRRDDRFLFATISRPQFIEPWLREMNRAGTLLRGVYSVPQAIAELAAQHMPRPCLLATMGSAGLRQTLVAPDGLRFSRLTPGAGRGMDEIAAAAAAEAAELHRYLCGKRLASRDMPLRTLVLVHPSHIDAFRRNCRSGAELQFEFGDLPALAAARGLKTPLADSCADPLFAYLLARRAPPEQFARAGACREWRLHRARGLLDLAGGTVLVLSLLFGAIQLSWGLQSREATAELRRRNLPAESESPGADSASLALPAAKLRELAAAAEALERMAPGPEPLLLALSHALDEAPALELESLDWRMADDDMGRTAHAVLDVRAVARGSPRDTRQIVERLQGRLAALPRTEAAVIEAPWMIDSSRAVRSDDDSRGTNAFLLRVSRQP
ncbi:MAG TPA: hypothetical protein VF816_12225 [Rhodocyclaceae bacterium]